MDQTTLAASLTIIGTALNASSQIAWISSAYFMYVLKEVGNVCLSVFSGLLTRKPSTSTSFQLLYGRLSDVWSRKLVLLAGLAIFFLGSLAASQAQTVVQLIVFRAITGIGGGGLMTIAQTIVSDVVTLRERGKYQGILVRLHLSLEELLTNMNGTGRRCCLGQWHWTHNWSCAGFSVEKFLVHGIIH